MSNFFELFCLDNLYCCTLLEPGLDMGSAELKFLLFLACGD